MKTFVLLSFMGFAVRTYAFNNRVYSKQVTLLTVSGYGTSLQSAIAHR